MIRNLFWIYRRISPTRTITGVGLVLLALVALFSVRTGWTAPSSASSPRALGAETAIAPVLHYQGRLLDPATGAAKPDGAYEISFRLYDVDTGGTPLWTETKDVDVKRGLFNTLLGDTTALPANVFNGQNLWLGIKVGLDSEAAPRQRIAPVAYALYADNADRLDGQQASAFAASGHNHDAAYLNAAGPDAMAGNADGAILSVTQNGTAAGSHAINGETASAANGVAGVRGAAGTSGTTIVGKHGVLGTSDTGKGVVGTSTDDYGILGWSTNTFGLRGEGENGGVYGLAWGADADAVFGNSTASTGNSWGVRGQSASPGGRGVSGYNSAATGTAYGVYGQSASSSGRGVYGYTSSSSGTTYGVYGLSSSSASGAGVRGDSQYVGVWGDSDGNWGVYGTSSADGGNGVYGYATGPNGNGVYGYAPGTGGYAGYFAGNARVTGNLIKGSGSFMIDHPLDPENKYLYHSFVESPDMMNIYNGNVVLDENGTATVPLPAWFEALNRDFRYQLTPIGGPGPNLYIAQGVQGNQFQIAGGTPGLQVSWQVTGIRQDPYANANRIPVEQEKPAQERGTYLHPDVYGQDTRMGADYQFKTTPIDAAEFVGPGGSADSARQSKPDLAQPQNVNPEQ